jgi:uncharacterized membrane protein
MARHKTKSPTRLIAVAPILGSFFGLLIGTIGAITALGSVLQAAVDALVTPIAVGDQ